MRPKAIEEATVAGVKSNRWCVYSGESEPTNRFEPVIPDCHPVYSAGVFESEPANFTFNNGKTAQGYFDVNRFLLGH